MPTKIKPTQSAIRVYDSQQELVRSGGESRPFDYPHLYQIQAGDWRISYAVEHDRLAILVLEVLTAEGAVRKDPASENLTRKMKVKLLDWPEGSPSHDLPPEELGKKLKIKLLDLTDEVNAEVRAEQRPKGRIKLAAASAGIAAAKPAGARITLRSEAVGGAAAAPGGGTDVERKVTPVDEPSM